MVFGTLHLSVLRILLNLLHDEFYLLHLQVHNVVHEALCQLHVLLEQVVVEIGILGERIHHITVEVDAQQATGVVGTERNLTAGVGRNGAETQVGIAVGQTLAQDGVPEQHTRLGTLPCVVYNLLPQHLGIDFLFHGEASLLRFLVSLITDGILLHVGFPLCGSLHEVVVDLHAHVGTGHPSFRHLSIDKRLGIGMLDTHGEHQCTATAVLRHLARTITIALHERNQSRGGQRGIVHRTAFGADMTQVVPHSTAALHQLHLFLVDAHDGTVGVGITVETDHETVAQRSHLEVVADTRHGRTCGHDIAEMVEQFKHLLSRQWIRILILHTGNLTGDTPVHICRILLVDITETVFHGILVDPHACGQFITIEIL